SSESDLKLTIWWSRAWACRIAARSARASAISGDATKSSDPIPVCWGVVGSPKCHPNPPFWRSAIQAASVWQSTEFHGGFGISQGRVLTTGVTFFLLRFASCQSRAAFIPFAMTSCTETTRFSKMKRLQAFQICQHSQGNSGPRPTPAGGRQMRRFPVASPSRKVPTALTSIVVAKGDSCHTDLAKAQWRKRTICVLRAKQPPLPSVLSLPTAPLHFPLLHYLPNFSGSKPISSEHSTASFSLAFSSLSLVWFGSVREICFNLNFILKWGWREDNLMDIRKGKREEIDEE
ncbi:unnamed protein product, partial [Thlaspi arvense]